MALEQGRQIPRSDILREGILPHGKAFMFLESFKVVEPGKKVEGRLADRTLPEFDYLADHFPGFPIFPGALSLEALAELSGIAVLSGLPPDNTKIGVLRKAHDIEWKQPIKPDDVIDLEAEVVFFRHSTGRAKIKAIKNGKIAVEGEITFMVGDKPKPDENLLAKFAITSYIDPK